MLRNNTALALLASLLFSVNSYAQITMGMVGDSLTDDYLGGPKPVNNDLAAYSWGQILAVTRASDLDFGPYKPVGDNWDENIRYAGYRNNWATSGGVASNNTRMSIIGVGNMPVTISGTSYLSAQTAGLAQSIAAGEISTVYVGIGSNDFFYRTTNFDTSGNFHPNLNAVIDQAFINDIASSILASVDTLRNAGVSSGHPVDLVLGLLPPGTAGGSSPSVLAGINSVNQLLMQGAAARGIPTVDTFGWNTDTTRVDSNGTVSIGHLQITQGSKATEADIGPDGTGPCDTSGCALPSHANHFSADDGLHPNTIIQALIANQIIATLNSAYDRNIAPIRDAEILALVGVPLPVACQTDADNDGVGASSFSFSGSACASGTTAVPLITSDVRLDAETESDNCPYASNADQLDSNSNGVGDACEDDKDSDTVTDAADNCPAVPNTEQLNSDGDAHGNACDSDDDNDGVNDNADRFPLDNLENTDADNDGMGDNGDLDDDNDTIADTTDNCPLLASSDQTNTDGDSNGNICDNDDDNDGVTDNTDRFPLDAAETLDNDNDGIGNNGDSDDDNDGVADVSDIFPLDANETLDNDNDGTGNNADTDDDNDGTTDSVEIALHTNPFSANPYTATTTTLSFEAGVPAGWSKPATANTSWQSTQTAATDGIKSLRTAPTANNQRSQIQTTLNIAGESFSFDVKVSTQFNYDVFRVYVDGLSQITRHGEQDWQTITISVQPGIHTIKFDYVKNASITAGSDAVWIDRLVYVDGTDTDNDAAVNAMDNDDDNDGVPDYIDAEPLNSSNHTEVTLPVNGIYQGSALQEKLLQQ